MTTALSAIPTRPAVEDLPGVGPQLAAAIRRRFKSDDGFYAAAQRLDLQALQEVEGISPKRAAQLVRTVRGDADAGAFFGTPAAAKIHETIMARIQGHAATSHGRNRLRLLSPAPDPDEAKRRIGHVMAQKHAVAGMDREAVRRALRRLKPLQDPKPVCDTTTLVVAGSHEAQERLHAMGVGKWALLGSAREAAQSEAELTIHAYDGEADIAADVEVPADAPLAALVPRALLAWVDVNRSTLEACRELAVALGKETCASEVLAADSATGRFDERSFRAALEEERKVVEDALQERLDALSLPASTMLRILSGQGLPPQLRKVIDPVLQEARKRLKAATQIDIQPYEATLPVTLDEEEIERVIEARKGSDRRRAFEAAQKTAKTIAKHQDVLRAEVAAWSEFDADFALGSFAHALDLQPPRFGQRFRIRDSVHLDLAASGAAQRIHYDLGGPTPVAVLTGANSGGKSTLLEHMAQLAIMARLGLPVVGDVEVPWFDEVDLVTPRRGLDAGAFETFLRRFLPIASGDARRLVLADEVESVTELEAAGRILAFFLDRLAATDSLCVLVTHMAEPILRHARADIRVDGIEATGLDDAHHLVVDRCPKMGHVARSTPELIVQRLVATSKGPDRALFAALLDTMRGTKNA